ncbi:MAG: U32 family peptidase [Bacteroidales bacterium]|nr:U32 family peptidase [Candidatus Cryptobacteroides onthequi]
MVEIQTLELLAPARNKDIGIAAIDCGADAVYMAGPGYGARKDAANSIEDVRELCSYAHLFGVRIFLTVNTIIYQDELDAVHRMMLEAQDAGVDAFIIQDPAITTWDDIRVPLHASTQCAVRTAQQAEFVKSLGFGRLVLERETSLKDVREIHEATECELEYFVHGALCVCYSGQCYMSEAISGRSANRGACIQACRSRYDLADEAGSILVRDKALLSLRDYRLKGRLEELAEAGVCSFKIEGRLKNASYVKNVVRDYSLALDELVSRHPDRYRRSSFGRVSGGFEPALDKTFNRGYTELWIDGRRGKWSSMDAPKSMGEFAGTVRSVRRTDRTGIEVCISPAGQDIVLRNGDGFAFAGKGGVIGFRGDVCEGNIIRCKSVDGLAKGVRLFRNISAAFEKELERNMPKREIPVTLDVAISGEFHIDITARSQDGREILSPFKCDADVAENRDRQEALIREQFSKRAGNYIFSVGEISCQGRGRLPLLSASTLNSIRRLIASDLDAVPCKAIPLDFGKKDESVMVADKSISYKYNVANSITRQLYLSRGAENVDEAYELTHTPEAELMRTRYCIRHELGLCPVHQGAKDTGRLFLLNNGRRFALGFDCRNCEMTVGPEV